VCGGREDDGWQSRQQMPEVHTGLARVSSPRHTSRESCHAPSPSNSDTPSITGVRVVVDVVEVVAAFNRPSLARREFTALQSW
jgi:hypothetical protein